MKALPKLILATALTLAGVANAAVVQGSGTGVFSALAGCDTTAPDWECRLTTSNTVLEWGGTDGFLGFPQYLNNPSTLTTGTTLFGPSNTTTPNLVLGSLTWFNRVNSDQTTDPNFTVNWTLTLDLTQPAPGLAGPGVAEVWNLTISNTPNQGGGTADQVIGLTVSDLTAFETSLNNAFAAQNLGIVVDLSYVLIDNTTGNGSPGFLNNVWTNPENASSTLQVVGNFSAAVPAPGVVALMGVGMLGLAAVGRRRQA